MRAPVAQWQRSRLVIGRLAGSNPLWGYTNKHQNTQEGKENQPNPLAYIFTCDKLYPPSFFGGVGEWFKPPDCKSGARKGFAGSNPAPSTISAYSNIPTILTAHIAQTVEHALGKGEVDGSSPSVGSSSHPEPKLNLIHSRRNLDGKAEI